MMARQRGDSLLPTRFAEAGSVQEDLSRTVKAEVGPVALFLLELYDQDRNPEYLEAARKGLSFLEKEVIPNRQWYDYETFWSDVLELQPATGQTSALDTFGEQPWLAVDTVYRYQTDLWRPLLAAYGRRPTRPFVLIKTVYEGEHDSK